MALDEQSQNVTTPMGHYNWKRFPMGFASAPGAFQKLLERIIEKLLVGLSFEAVLVNLDDIIIFGRSFEEHPIRLDLVPGRLKDAGLGKKFKM